MSETTRVEYVVRDASGRDYWHTYDNPASAQRCADANNDPLDEHHPELAYRGPWSVVVRTITERPLTPEETAP